MGMYHSAFLAYGFQIPDTDEEEMDRKIPSGTDVGHLRAGAYDREMTFLVTACDDADLGKAETVTPQDTTPEQYETWNADLKAAAAALSISDTPVPSWLLIPDMS
jgi:hypothetical protein